MTENRERAGGNEKLSDYHPIPVEIEEEGRFGRTSQTVTQF